jgi:hypothetical protein
MALLWPLWQDGDMPSDGHGDRGPSLADLAPVVRQERLRRGLSAEQAGKLGGISKAGWQHIEAGTAKRSDHWRMAVAKAFGWPENWPDNPPDPPEVVEVKDQLAEALTSIQQQMSSLGAEVAALRSEIAELRGAAGPAQPAARRSPAKRR